MSYFPAFIQLKHKKILLVGGGKIAQEKLEKLLDFSMNIDIIALDFSESMMLLINKNNLYKQEKVYEKGDIAKYAIVVVAVDDIKVQENIYQESQEYNCLCNCVDSVEFCDFIFPSYVKKENLTIAISTSGSSPALAKYLKIYLRELIPDSITEFLQEMKKLRETLPKGEKRMKMLDEKAKKYIESL